MKPSRSRNTFAFGLAASALIAVSARVGADPVVFDFEDQIATAPVAKWPSVPGALHELNMTKSGITVRITRPGSNFDLDDNTKRMSYYGPKPVEFGRITLDPFSDEYNPAPLIVDFSQPLAGFSVDMGDFGEDTDTLLLRAYSGPGGTGTVLGSDTAVLDAVGIIFSYKTLKVDAPGIRSVRMFGGSSCALSSIYYDNFRLEPDSKPSQ